MRSLCLSDPGRHRDRDCVATLFLITPLVLRREWTKENEEEEGLPKRTPRAPKKPKPSESAQPTRKSKRLPKLSDYVRRLAAGEGVTGEDISDMADCAYSADQQQLIIAAIQEAEGDPKTLSEAQAQSDWPRWKEAMDRELATLEKAETWSTVPRPPDKNVVGSKWVFRIKRKADGSIEKYKVRLVACGFTQVYGVDYFDTFSPVAKLASFRTILTIAAKSDWEIKSFDFNGAYLNGELDEHEEIYMQFPPGYDTPKENMVKWLHKSLYGLKQAGRRWYDTLARALADHGFRVTQADPGVFYCRIEDHILILAIHIDDCIFTGDSAKLIAEYKNKLNKCYALTDLGPVH